MLYEFITMHRNDIVARARERVRRRPWPAVSSRELEHGVPLFLTQLSETLRLEGSATPFATDAIGATAARHGAEAFGERRGADRSSLGLGLSIARQAIRAHGGEIRVRNMPGRGCVFTIDLPLAPRGERVPTSTSRA